MQAKTISYTDQAEICEQSKPKVTKENRDEWRDIQISKYRAQTPARLL
jgi:hypothetical protein